MTCRRSSMSELFELLDRLQSSRLDDQRCEMPQVPEHPLQPFDNLYSISTYESTLISPAPPPPLLSSSQARLGSRRRPHQAVQGSKLSSPNLDRTHRFFMTNLSLTCVHTFLPDLG